MAFFDENTSVVRMKRDFDQFVQDHDESRGVGIFSLDNLSNTSFRNRSGDSGSVSVQALLEKEKSYKLKEADYIAARSEITRLEAKIASLETSNKRAKLDYEQQIEAVQCEKSRENQRMLDTQSQLKFLKDRESQANEALAECQKEAERQRKKYEEQILSLQKERIQLSDEIQQEKEQSWEKITQLKSEMMRNDTELKICTCELEETKAQLKLQLKRSSEISNQMKDLEELRLKYTQAEQKIKDLELQIERMEEDHIVGKAMKSQLTTFQEMEKENRRLLDENQYLRDIQENNLLLKEQHDSMKKKLDRLEDKLVNYNKLVAENEVMKARLDHWENADKSGHRLRYLSPSDLTKRVTELQNAEAIMLSKQGELQTSLHLKENSLHSLLEQVNSLQQQVVIEKGKHQQEAELIKRLKRKLLLVTKERDGYKRIIDSYESEVTVSMDSAGSLSRVHHLEESVQGYKKQTEFLDAELNRVNEELTSAKQHARQVELRLSQLQHASHNGVSSSPGDQQTILHLRERVANLEKALEKCEQEKYTLECRIEQRHLQGDYDPTKLKVLHFKMNPVDIATEQRREEVSKLKAENERLKQRIEILEENEGRIEDLTVAVEQKLKEPGSSKDIEEMRSQLTTAELKNKRLMEAFKKTSQEIREVCYQLTGYKIDIPTSNQYRLTSMYAESSNDFLLFKQNSNGDIEMLGTSFSSTMQDLMEMYLIRQDSIPAFLSGVTLELFSRQTMNFG
ncbi:mitotic spindle assembly checkpoint protein MAD1-like isoform X1 [Mercenaria mercenaria]|uniref:mitotic spindle assembly checkpoint protein MAD1-like isoform X1 n=1 Tax=Mercenaria mercenaria TaxID=6596 RepID=UPI001E1DD20F|nr:mitotic spindle assembly checkpoint protein MAD1-like isoform X1 [Mercenaria mercenaria]XP_045214246.1 mitotic spindle assembly checkpoint protein MAD1-like isoform X1 [Mercenaria mercenaria]